MEVILEYLCYKVFASLLVARLPPALDYPPGTLSVICIPLHTARRAIATAVVFTRFPSIPSPSGVIRLVSSAVACGLPCRHSGASRCVGYVRATSFVQHTKKVNATRGSMAIWNEKALLDICSIRRPSIEIAPWPPTTATAPQAHQWSSPRRDHAQTLQLGLHNPRHWPLPW